MLSEPLLHFAVLGLALFVAFDRLSVVTPSPADAIVVGPARIELLRSTFERSWRRPPSAVELQGLIDDYVREEIAVREAQAMGIDRDDATIRRLLRQKLEFVATDIALQAEPDEAQLRAFLAAHPEAFRRPARYSFSQILLDPLQRGASWPQQAETLLRQLNDGSLEATQAAALGDPTQLEGVVTDLPADELEKRLGGDFVAALASLPRGRWVGPVASGYGQHLLRIERVEPGDVPDYPQVAAQVRREWDNQQRQQALDAFYAGLRERYPVRLDAPAATP